jgi:hypothetical protein
MTDGPASLDAECFFIAPIGKEGTSERNRSDGILEFIVARAAEELGLTAIRGDQISEPGQITLQVIDHVLGARAAVADLTYLNPNVFYELAVRHTARLPTTLIAEKGCDLPFDIAQMRTIFFDHTDLRSADSCRIAIVAQLREALDKGIVDSPITTSVDVRALQGGNEAERNIAELVTTVEDISKVQRLTLEQVHLTLEWVNQVRLDPPRSGLSAGTLRDREAAFEDMQLALREAAAASGIIYEMSSEQDNIVLQRAAENMKSIIQYANDRWKAIQRVLET